MISCSEAHESVREWVRYLPCSCTSTRCTCLTENRHTEVVYAKLTRWPCTRTGPHDVHLARDGKGTTYTWGGDA